MTHDTKSASPVASHGEPPESQFERHRIELTGYCYRMLGSPFEAEDAVQETFARAWRGLHRFEGRSQLRTWLYRIAYNVCIDMLRASRRRARPMDLAGPLTPSDPLDPPLPGSTWIEPVPDDHVLTATADPAELAVARESIRLALIAALQHLPPRQRAVLILRDVLAWHAAEVAELLDTTVASANSALQRARATLAARKLNPIDISEPVADSDSQLLARYMEAFERYDFDLLATLIHADAIQSMPPYALWLRGREDIFGWWAGPGIGCRGSRLVPIVANGRPAFGQYKPSGPGGTLEPWAVQVLDVVDGRIAEFTFFLDTYRLFPLFGLPSTSPGIHPGDADGSPRV
jgi:RNA polymerase sigma-70 factor (ECF subfamily)